MRRRELLTAGALAGVGVAAARPPAAAAQTPPADSVFNVKTYGAVGNGTTDDTAAIQAAINAALVTGGTVWLPAGAYRITTSLLLNGTTSNVFDKPLTLQGVGDASVIRVENTTTFTSPNSKTALWASGRAETKYALPASVPAGSREVTVAAASAAALTIGSVFAIEDASAPPVYANNTKPFELHKVIGKNGNTIELDSPLLFAYGTTGKSYKMTVVQGLTVRDLAITAINDPNVGGEYPDPNQGCYSMFFKETHNTSIENVRIFNAAGGIQLVNALDSHITDCTIDTLPRYIDAAGYGVSLNGACKDVTILGLVGRATRHLFTTLADSRGAPGAFGGPTNVRIIGGIGEGGDRRNADPDPPDWPGAVWDTHDQGTNISFIGCSAIGGAAGFQIRAKNVEMVDCIANNNHLDGFWIVWVSENVTIRGGEARNNGRGGILIRGAPSSSVEGVRITGNNEEGVHWTTWVSGTTTYKTGRVQVTDCDIRDNKVAGIAERSTAAADKATEVVIARNIVPKSLTAGLQPNSVKGLGAANTVVANNVFRGYGTGNDGTVGLDAGVVKQNNVTGP